MVPPVPRSVLLTRRLSVGMVVEWTDRNLLFDPTGLLFPQPSGLRHLEISP